MLIVRGFSVSVLQFGPNYHRNLETELHGKWWTMAVSLDAETGNFWLFQRGITEGSDQYRKLALRKISAATLAGSVGSDVEIIGQGYWSPYTYSGDSDG